MRALMGVLCVTVVLGGAGCFGGDDSDESANDGGASEQSASTVRTDAGAETETSASTSSADTADDALGSSKGSYENSTLQLASLERTSPDVVTAKFSITVPQDADSNFQVSDRLASKERGFQNGQNEVSGATLTDERGAKRYYVLTDTDGECLCTTEIAGDGFVDKGTTAQLYAKFPAPPGSTKTASFEVPTFQSIDDVAIADAQ